MPGLTDPARLVATFLNGILAGIFVGSSLIEHAARTLSGPHWIAYKQAKERLFGPVMPAIFGIAVLACVAAVIARPNGCLLIATASLAIVLAITVTVHLPLNKRIQSFSQTAFPPDWADARRRWRDWNWLRCLLAVIAFGAILIGRSGG